MFFKTLTQKILAASKQTQQECFKLLLENLDHSFIKAEVERLFLIEKKVETVLDYTKDYLDCSIDFNNINVFSIERVAVGSREERTIVGYTFKNSIKEWTLGISREHHKKLIEKYEQHKNNV